MVDVTELSDETFEEIAKMNCPHCAAGSKLRRRLDSGEWVHDTAATKQSALQTHTLCHSNGMRVARYKSKVSNG